MPFLFLSPSTQDFNPYVTTGNEQYWMNRIADEMEPYLRASGVNFTRNNPAGSAAQSIRDSNAGQYDFHLALHSNAAVVCCRRADVIIGPVGIVIADALLGEVTPRMAVAVGQSAAKRILIPVNHCANFIAGVADMSVGRLVDSVVAELEKTVCRS